MGAFLTANKNGYFWTLVSYLSGGNIYVKDRSLLPYTPDRTQTYTDFYPAYYNFVLPQMIRFEINGVLAGQATVNDPSGLVYVDIVVPKGKFTLVAKAPDGTILKSEVYKSKNYAMFLGVAAQSYDERRTAIELNKADQRFQQMRSARIYPILGSGFDFPPPPGWPVSKYRAAILGGCGPGFIKSFFEGSTRAGVIDTIKSITCQDPNVYPARRGVRWVVRSRANSYPVDPAAKGFFVTTRANLSTAFTPPHYRAVVASAGWWANAADVVVNGSVRAVTNEFLIKKTNSYVESKVCGPYDLQSLTFKFSIEEVGDATTKRVYDMIFPIPAFNAADLAAAITTAYPVLSDAIYASPAGQLRIGVYPVAGKTFKITIISGTALDSLGFKEGDSAEVAPDQLANPWLTTPVTLSVGATTFTDGVDFTSVPETGEIVWIPSNAVNASVPTAGSTLRVSYSYQLRREITRAVDLVKHTNSVIQYEWN